MIPDFGDTNPPMRWAIIGLPSKDSLEHHLQDTLQRMGHDAQIFDLYFLSKSSQVAHYYIRLLSESYDRYKAKQLAARILDYEPDIVLAVYRFIHPDTIKLIKQARPSITTVHLNPDALVNLQQQQILASNYDFLFTKEPFMQRFLKDKAGLNAYYLPEAFNPGMHKRPNVDRPALEDQVDTDVMFFGNMYPYRVKIIEQILDERLKIKLYGVKGRYFPKSLERYFMNRVIIDQDKALQIWGSRIIFNCFHYAEIEAVNNKYFEINGIGGFQLCDFKDILHDYSPVPPEKYSFRNMSEARELIWHYLANPQERYEIADLQQEHFLQHHTYENRFRSMLSILYPG